MLRFSVIIPNYNKDKYIDDCLSSVFSQTFDKSKIEIIVVDDGSTDSSVEIIKSYDVKLFHTKRLFAGGARNKGLENATGEYIIFLDSDDYLANELVLEKLDKCLNGQDIVYLNFDKLYFDGRVKHIIHNHVSLDEHIENMPLLGVTTKCFKKEILKNIYFPERCVYEDLFFTLSVMCKVKSEVYFDEIFFIYRRVEQTITTGEMTEEKMLDLFIQITSLYKLCVKHTEHKNALLSRIARDKLNLRLDIIDKYVKTGKNCFGDFFDLN